MSWLSGTSERVAGGWLSSAYPGLGATGAAIKVAGAVGDHGAGIALNDGLIDTKEYIYQIATQPTPSGTVTLTELAQSTMTVASDGTYAWSYLLWEDGVPLPATYSVTTRIGVAPPQSTLNITTDSAIFSGSPTPGNSVQVAMAIATDAAVLTGSAGSVAATLTTSAFSNNTGNVLINLTGLTVAILRFSDFALAQILTNQTTNGSGVLVINSFSIVARTDYVVVTRNSNGTALGCEKYTAA